MSFFPGKDPAPGNKGQCESISDIVVPRSIDIDGLVIQRALPSTRTRMVGPFIFFDHFGPALFRAGQGVDVRPHPHIGLSTLTYMFEGEIVHRDSLGFRVEIRPGEVNWMTAGRGIVHSERTAPERRVDDAPIHGLQCWVAMPAEAEESDPSFAHYDVPEFPEVSGEGKHVRIVTGSAFGKTSPVRTTSETLFVDARLAAGSSMPLDAAYEERGIYTVSGEIDIAGDRFGPDRLLVFRPGDKITVRALSDAHLMLLGGAAMDGPRYLWWNFVSSRKERIDQAKAEWKSGRFGIVPGDAEEFIPLPD
jgi:redox-sensitive bicupin YhaK (pirin superfamily)